MLHNVIEDENGTDMKNGTHTKRRINLELLGKLLWGLLTFVCVRRYTKTRAKALVLVLFRVLVKEHPEHFRDILVQESRTFLRREVFKAWKFQRTIDLCATGGLNYEACNTIRSGV